ncbi:hypothetical protein HanPI659440_Chr10g0377191 [Helianthus annuus]|nr:hypothetical protein HanPI659440_Chr10g0377191 [Helianthus annuus]
MSKPYWVVFCQNMAPRRAVNARDQPPPPPLPRTAEELNARLEERISAAIAQYEANRTEQIGGPSNARRIGNGDSSGGDAAQGCTFKQFLDCKPLNFDGTGGAVAFVLWTEKTETHVESSGDKKRNAREDPNVVTGTFLVNNHFASILFDTRADYSFLSVEFKRTLGIESSRLEIPYSIELADGKLVESSEVVRGCTLELGE